MQGGCHDRLYGRKNLQGIGVEDLAAAQRRAIETAHAMSGDGTPARHIRSTVVPSDGRCKGRFEADSAEVVRQLNDKAHIPCTRVLAVMDLTRSKLTTRVRFPSPAPIFSRA